MEQELERYLKQVRRRLRVDRATRTRILDDLTADLYDRVQRGESPAEIIAGMGPAKEVAEGFNEAFRPEAERGRPAWRWAFLAAGVLLFLVGTLPAFVGWLAARWEQARFLEEMETSGIVIIGGADGPTAVFVASRLSPVELFLPVILGCMAVFCALQWPGRRGWRRWLPAALAVLGLLAWLAGGAGLAAEAYMMRELSAPWQDILRMLLAGTVKRFFTQGGFVPLGALVWLAVRPKHGGGADRHAPDADSSGGTAE